MEILEVHFIIPSADPQKSFQFYVDGLLFNTVSEHPKIGMFTVGLGSFRLCFVNSADACLSGAQQGRYALLSIWPKDIESYYARIREIGLAKIERELDYYPGHMCQFSVIDVNGYRVVFNQKVTVS